MSMLAEPRRRQKYSTDPRGLNWSNDDGKFGQKLMEKMGWQKGKGLGAQEDGRLNHVAVTVKGDTKGVGCSKNHADNWIAHQDDFNTLLSELNQSENKNTETQLQNLEKKSKQSRARVHYKKLIKGKDLSSAKEVDLASIFGRRKKKFTPSVEVEEALSSQSQSEVNSEEDDAQLDNDKDVKTDTSYGITTVNSGTSVADYFARKMAEMKAKAADKTTTPEVVEMENNSEYSNATIQDCDRVDSADDRLAMPEKETSRKIRKKKRKHQDLSLVVEEESGDVIESSENVIKTKRKKQKRSKYSADISETKMVDDFKESIFGAKKAAKKERNDDDSSLCNVDVSHNTDEESGKKSKKKKKKSRERSSTPQIEEQVDKEEPSNVCTTEATECNLSTAVVVKEEKEIEKVEIYSDMAAQLQVGKEPSDKCTPDEVKQGTQSAEEKKLSKNKKLHRKVSDLLTSLFPGTNLHDIPGYATSRY